MTGRYPMRTMALVAILITVLLVAGCVPGGQIPQTGGTAPAQGGSPAVQSTQPAGSAVPDGTQSSLIPQTGGTASSQGTRTGDSSQQEGNPGATIPKNGPVGQPPAPGSSAIPTQGRNFGPRISLAVESVAPGDEIIIDGNGFTAGQMIRVFLGDAGNRTSSTGQATAVPRQSNGTQTQSTAVPGQSGVNQGQTLQQPKLIGSLRVGDTGGFALHAILPNPLPAGAVTDGQLLITVVDESENQVANTVVLAGGLTGQGTSVPGSSTIPQGQSTQAVQPTQSSGSSVGQNGSVDLGQLGFSFDTFVLPLLNQALGTNFTMSDLQVTSLEATTWPDSCLGLGSQGEFCTQVQTPGYRIQATLGRQSYEIRTGPNGLPVRITQPVR